MLRTTARPPYVQCELEAGNVVSTFPTTSQLITSRAKNLIGEETSFSSGPSVRGMSQPSQGFNNSSAGPRPGRGQSAYGANGNQQGGRGPSGPGRGRGVYGGRG